MMEWLKKRMDMVLTLAVTGAGLILYTLTAAPSVLMADGGEFQFVPYMAGITHPTGYPFYTILGWVWTHLVVIGEVAYRMNLFSVLWGGITVGLTYQVALWSFRLVAPECPVIWRRALSVLSALLLAVSGTFWSQAVIAEVYTLNGVFVAAVLYVALRLWNASTNNDSNAATWLVALSLVYGFSLTHHRTMVLMFPWLVLFVWMVTRKTVLPWHGAIPWVLAGLLLPQLLYLYIPWRAPHVPYLELSLDADRTLVLYEKSLSGFLDLVLAGAFGGQLSEGPITTDRFAMAFDLLRSQFAWAGILLGAISILSILRRRVWVFLILTILPYLTYVAFNLLYFIGDIYVLFIPSYLIWAIWIGLGVWELAYAVSYLAAQRRKPAGRPKTWRFAAPIVVLSFGLPIILLIRNYTLVDQSVNWEAAQLWRPVLAQPLPEDSILVSNDRDEIMPMWYYQNIDGLKPDWMGMFPLIVRQPGYGDISQIIDRALESGRQVFLIKPMPGLELKYRLESQDLLVQVTASHRERQPRYPADISFGESVRLIGYDQVRTPEGTVEITLFWEGEQEMKQMFSSFVHLVDASGKTVANHDHRPGGVYYPTTMWKPGGVLLDTHTISIPPDASGEYTLTTGLYIWPSMERLGEEAAIGQIPIDN